MAPPGIAYWAAGYAQLYVALTNRCQARTLPQTRGPSFGMPTFTPLPTGYEPDANAVGGAISAALAARAPGASELSGVCFAGLGEPLLRASTLVEVASRLRAAHGPALAIRVNTNGLCEPPDTCVRTAEQLKAAGVTHVSVAFMAADAIAYDALMRPDPTGITQSFAGEPADAGGLWEATPSKTAFERVCAFVAAAAAVGLEVEATAVTVPGVDLGEAEALAWSLGATSWRARSFHA